MQRADAQRGVTVEEGQRRCTRNDRQPSTVMVSQPCMTAQLRFPLGPAASVLDSLSVCAADLSGGMRGDGCAHQQHGQQ